MVTLSLTWQDISAVVLGMVWHDDDDTDTDCLQQELISHPVTAPLSENIVSRMCDVCVVVKYCSWSHVYLTPVSAGSCL